jgi:hypothetical protein
MSESLTYGTVGGAGWVTTGSTRKRMAHLAGVFLLFWSHHVWAAAHRGR